MVLISVPRSREPLFVGCAGHTHWGDLAAALPRYDEGRGVRLG